MASSSLVSYGVTSSCLAPISGGSGCYLSQKPRRQEEHLAQHPEPTWGPSSVPLFFTHLAPPQLLGGPAALIPDCVVWRWHSEGVRD